MIQPTQIREHMEILGSDGQHVGKVDHMDGSTRSPNFAGINTFV